MLVSLNSFEAISYCILSSIYHSKGLDFTGYIGSLETDEDFVSLVFQFITVYNPNSEKVGTLCKTSVKQCNDLEVLFNYIELNTIQIQNTYCLN